MQKKTCTKCKRIAVVIDRGIPLCGDCYCKLEKIGKEEKNIEIFFKTKNEIQKMINIKEFNNSSHIAAFSYCINHT